MKYLIILITFQFLSLYIFSQVVNESEIKSKYKSANNSQAFIENKGQWNDEVLYLSKVNGANVWITKSGVVYNYYQMETLLQDTSQSPLDRNMPRPDPRSDTQPNYNICGHILKMELQNGNQEPKSIGVGKKETYYNYFIGNDKSKWAPNVAIYNEVIVEDLYEGISAKYYYDGNSIRYDYIADAGADISQIKMNYEGQDDIKVNNLGELLIQTRFGEIRHNKIYAYQEINNQKVEIECKFKQNSESQFSFDLGKYNPDFALVIDPIVWSTFIGGSENDVASSITIDGVGNIYIAGGTNSENFPTSSGTYDDIYEKGLNGEFDAIISKLSSDGSSLIYSTFIGGSSADFANGITLDKSNNIYITGNTTKAKISFPTTSGAFSENHKGNVDSFVSKLSSDGNNLLYSTYVGGFLTDIANGICLDDSNNVYIAGETNSKNFPVTSGAYDETFSEGPNGQSDVFISKLSNDGSKLLYSTYIGGVGYDIAYGICLDNWNNAYITGYTERMGNIDYYPITPGAYNNSKFINYTNVIVTKLSSDGSKLLYSTYFGGSFYDEAYGICLDDSNNVYITGRTLSSDFPTTKGAFDESFNSSGSKQVLDAFVCKLSSDGSSLLFSTFIGGTKHDVAYGICQDEWNNIYITGSTNSSNFPTTKDAFDEKLNGDIFDAFICKLSRNGSTLLYSSFFDGTLESGQEIVIDNSNNVYLIGNTTSSKYITTGGAYDESHNGEADIIITKMNLTTTSVSAIQNRNIELNIIYEGRDIFAKFNSKTINSKLRIYSLDGALISTEKLNNTIGNNQVNLKANELKSGSYIVQIVTGEEVYNEKFVVTK